MNGGLDRPQNARPCDTEENSKNEQYASRVIGDRFSNSVIGYRPLTI
jgi:hypothetical protein